MKRTIKAYTAPVVFDLRDGLFMIADRYNTSDPVSGDWDTEVEHEMKTIADAFNISEESAKDLMINELGFGEIDFVELYASTNISKADDSYDDEEVIEALMYFFDESEAEAIDDMKLMNRVSIERIIDKYRKGE